MRSIQHLLFIFTATILLSLTRVAKAHYYYDETEVPPFVNTTYPNCFDCVREYNQFWCPDTQECYTYDGEIQNITGRDCTRPSEYTTIPTWTVPKRNQWSQDYF